MGTTFQLYTVRPELESNSQPPAMLTELNYVQGVSNPDRKAPIQPGFLSYLLSTKETGMSGCTQIPAGPRIFRTPTAVFHQRSIKYDETRATAALECEKLMLSRHSSSEFLPFSKFDPWRETQLLWGPSGPPLVPNTADTVRGLVFPSPPNEQVKGSNAALALPFPSSDPASPLF